MNFKLVKNGVRRLDDLATIPNDPDNTDWKAFLAWQAAGNQPQAMDPDPVPTDLSNMDNLDRVTKSVLQTIAQITSTPAAQVKSIFKTKYDNNG